MKSGTLDRTAMHAGSFVGAAVKSGALDRATMHAGGLVGAAVNSGGVESAVTDSDFTGECSGRSACDAERRCRGDCNDDFV
jgi:hypothetical protein